MKKIATNHGDYRVNDRGGLDFRPKRARIFRPYSPDAKAGLAVARNAMDTEAAHYAEYHQLAKADAESLALLLAMVTDVP